MKNTMVILVAVIISSTVTGFATSEFKKPPMKPDVERPEFKRPKSKPFVDLREGKKPQQRPKSTRPGMSDSREGGRRTFRPDEGGAENTMLRLFEDPRVCSELKIESEVRKQLMATFQAIDKDVHARRKELLGLQRVQAKLIMEGAHEADVMAAVDAVWTARADIAKFQTQKLLKLRSVLTEEQIKKLNELRKEVLRDPRMYGVGARRSIN